MGIPDDVIDDIRHRADIVAVVGRHVQLKKSGRNHMGQCPFHGDKTPSFSVSGDKGFFYCFGCQKKGDVFTFVMELEGKSFMEAVESLAEQFGVALPARELQSGPHAGSPRTAMLRLNATAMTFFEKTLAEEAGARTREYLERRGISPETSKAFRLGAAPAGWSGLVDHLKANDQNLTLADTLGLIATRQRGGSGGGYYDRFRDRIVCPVMTAAGEVAGFSARRLVDEGEGADGPKYFNSPESPVYKKSKLLFGLYQARDAMRKKQRAILVEGNFDVISLSQAGFPETVAPLGTALTEDQAELLRRLVPRVVLLYDGDRAGLAATRKAIRALVTTDIEVMVATLPAGEDPDSLVRKHGAEALEERIAHAKPGIEYYLFEVWGESGPSADSKARALREVADVLAAMKDATARDFAIGTFAQGLGVNRDDLLRGLRRAVRGGEVQSVDKPRAMSENRTAPISAPPRRELEALAFLTDHPSLLPLADELNLFSYLTDQRLRDMYSAARNGVPLVSATPDDPTIVSHILAGAYTGVARPQETLREIVAVLAKDRSLAHLAPSKRGLAPDEERKRFQEIVNTRRQVD